MNKIFISEASIGRGVSSKEEVFDSSIYKLRMFAEPVKSILLFHRWINKIIRKFTN